MRRVAGVRFETWRGLAVIAAAVVLSGPILMHAAPADRYFAGSSSSGKSAAAAIPATDPACKPVYDASDKLMTVDNHMFMNQTDATGKNTSSELITAGGARYILYGGKWSRSEMNIQEMKQQEEENKKNAKNNSCHYLRDETVNGEAVAFYTEHSESEFGKTDSRVWISKGKGLIVKEEIDLDVGGAAGKNHMAMRYEYSNVHAPAM